MSRTGRASAPAIASRSAATGRGRRLDVVVLVVRRDRLQPVPELELHAVGQRARAAARSSLRFQRVARAGCRRCRGPASSTPFDQVELGGQRRRRSRAPARRSGAGCSSRCRTRVRSIVVSSESEKRSPPVRVLLRLADGAGRASTGGVTPGSCSSPAIAISLPRAADLGRGERDLGRALGVEEVGRLEMRLEVLVLDLDAADRRLAGEGGGAVLGDRRGSRRPARSCRGRCRRRSRPRNRPASGPGRRSTFRSEVPAG